jgi:sodium/hydrogen exchanger 8
LAENQRNIARSRSPELLFFILLPPIIFHSGFCFEAAHFFDNVGAITLFAFLALSSRSSLEDAPLCSKGGSDFGMTRRTLSSSLLFGRSTQDPIATLSIMANADLRCDQLLYSLVFVNLSERCNRH